MSTLFDKSIQILNYLSAAHEPRGVIQIGRDLGMPKSSTSRLLSMLYQHDLVKRTLNGRYHLGPGALNWAHSYKQQSELISICNPSMERIAHITDQTVLLMSYGEGFRLYLVHSLINKRATRHPPPNNGELISLSCCAAGKAILMSLPQEELDKYLALAPLQPKTAVSIVNENVLRTQLQFFKSRGYAEDDEEFCREICSVAAPILNTRGYPVGSICIMSSSYRNSRQEMARAGQIVADISVQIQNKHYSNR